jgi:hypothetical protein
MLSPTLNVCPPEMVTVTVDPEIEYDVGVLEVVVLGGAPQPNAR